MDKDKVKKQKYIRGLKGLASALKELGLPNSLKTLRSYEEQGMIPVNKGANGMRFYSEKDIEEIVRIVAGKKVNKF